MSKKKGVSAEEKRSRMLQLFYEKKEFFQLKELEKIAPKEKGIISQAVKEVVQNLVDDGLVDTDKIGTSVYYWAYPSKARHTRKRKLDDLNSKTEEVKIKLQKSKENVQTAATGREDTAERMALLQNVQKLKSEEEALQKELKNYSDCDPEVLEQMKAQTQIAKDAANRWTDNIFAIKSWCKNKFFIEEDVLNKQFGIDPELDYLN